ncbi:uncharacterized protein LOC143217030 isoform X2 [Lasioglossum baleicum]|uniref:uncharacterized protein LOC143217030 isoform X2 n=1 Tax=Lasioglossum baleicum TaxID=434251 RepID=UPI003FCCAD26
MSYAEHGPRIFLAGKPNTGIPLTYGDYVLPRKRLEGRLKLHDSCSDIRAWSPNSLETSRYFRELNEHDSSIGKIIPVNVVVDNIIRLNSHTQTELQIVKKELQKYKSLKLTPKQEEQLQNLKRNQKFKESVPIVHSNSCLSIHLPTERNFQNDNDKFTFVNQSTQLRPYSLTAFNTQSSKSNHALVSQFRPDPRTLLTEDYIERAPRWVEYIDIALQVEQETHDVGVQFDGQVDKYLNKIITTSAMSQTSFTYKSSEEDNNLMESDKINFETNNYEEDSLECDTSCSGSSQDIGTLSKSNSELTESDKSIIIQKDSEIIALKHKLRAWDLELDEVQGLNKKLEISLQEKEDYINAQKENLEILRDKLIQIEREYNCEIEDLKTKLHNCKYLINQLKQDLSKKCESCHLHLKEIEKLKLYAEEASTLRLDRELLLQKLQKMEELSEKVEKYDLALSRLKKVQHEKDCILADQEKEIKQLLALISKTTVTYEEQENTKRMIESLETEICEKNMKISQYEQQFVSMKRETSEFVNNLKHALNNLEEFNGFCEDVYNCENCNLDITAEANHLLYNINVIMTRFQSYKIERQNLLQQIENLKHSVEDDKHQIYFNQSLRNMISDILKCESEVNTRNTGKIINSILFTKNIYIMIINRYLFYIDRKDSIIVLNVRQNKCNWNEIECEDISNSVNSEHSSNGMADNEYNNYIIKLSKKNSMNEIDKEILEYFSHFILKLRFLTKKLQVYLEVERPLMIKQIYNFYEMLQETESAINDSQDLALKKQRISELDVLLNERRTKYETYMTHLPNDLSQIQIKIIEFIKTILNQLLNAILYVEKNNLSNKRIDEAFKSYFKSYISSMRAVIQGAGDQRTQILEKIEEQQQELQKKNEEIVELKEEVAQYARKGEGDSIRAGENNALLKEQLVNVEMDLCAKDEFILQLEEQKRSLEIELSKSNEDYNTLKSQNKNYEKELELKTTQLKESQLYLDTAGKEKHEIEMEFLDLQSENSNLKKKLILANTTISSNDDTLGQLYSDFNKEIFEHKNKMAEQCCEIESLKDENTLLNKKLRNAENKLSELNQTILSLNEQNDKIDMIYSLQEDFARLDKNEKKLKTELNNLKTQLVIEQNNTKKADSNLSEYERKNEKLKQNVEYLKNQNSELSLKRYTETVEEKLKSRLYTLSTKIHEKIFNFSKLFDLEEHVSNEQSDENLKDEYLKYQNINENLKSSRNQKKEMKENEIEEVQNEQLCNSMNVECEILKVIGYEGINGTL